MSDLDPQVMAILEEAQRHGVIGKAPLASHIDQARGFLSFVEDGLPSNARLLDLGSGGGLPGLVIADGWPKLHVTLLDGRSSRAESLALALDDLGWRDRITVIGQRAEEAGRDPRHRASYDLVVARGFGPPAVAAECAAPFLKVGGLFVVSDPPGGGESERWPAQGCAVLGLEVLKSQVSPWSLTALRQRELCDERYPRRTGVPLKRPLFG